MAYDVHSTLATSTIVSVSNVSTTYTIVVTTGDGSKFSANQQVVISPPNVQQTLSNSMIGRVTAISVDTLTVICATANREGTSIVTVLPGYQIINGITPKALTDIETITAIVFNVKLYSAKGDGITDDTTAIQACITACAAGGGGTVFFPPGNYIITPPSVTVSALTIPSNVVLAGAGLGGTILTKNANGILLDFSGPGPFSETTNWNLYQGLRDLQINGNNLTGLVIRLYYLQFYYEKNVYIYNNSDTFVDMAQCFDSRFENGLYLSGGSSSAHASTHLIRCSAAPQTTLSSGISGVITSLPVVALTAAMPAGIVQVWNGAGQVQNFTTSGASVSATSIPVVAATVAHTFVSTDVVNGFGWSGDSTNACMFDGCHWEDGLSGAIWITAGVNSTNQVNNIFFYQSKIEEDFIGYDCPQVQIDGGADAIFFDGLYGYAGGFNSGYSTPVPFIQWEATDGAISNVMFATGTVQTTTSAIVLNNNASSFPTAVSNVYMYWGAQPTVSGITVSTGSAGYFFNVIMNGTISVNTPYSGSGTQQLVGNNLGYAQFNDAFFFYGITHHAGGTDTSGVATYSTPSFSTTVAQQLSNATDVILYIAVTTAVTATVAIGATSGASNSIMPSKLLPLGTLLTIRVPCNWYVEVTCATMADLQFSQVTC